MMMKYKYKYKRAVNRPRPVTTLDRSQAMLQIWWGGGNAVQLGDFSIESSESLKIGWWVLGNCWWWKTQHEDSGSKITNVFLFSVNIFVIGRWYGVVLDRKICWLNKGGHSYTMWLLFMIRKVEYILLKSAESRDRDLEVFFGLTSPH